MITTAKWHERAPEGYAPTVESLLRPLRYPAIWLVFSRLRGYVQRGEDVAYVNAAAGEVTHG